MTNPVAGMSALELAYAAKKLSANHAVLRAEPIAVVGMSCRFPGGAHNLAGFQRLLHEGVDAVKPIPTDRWDLEALFDALPKTDGPIPCRRGGFLSRIYHFDAAFFGITHAEARGLDPQQRLLLEVAWEAVTNSGIHPRELYGTGTGVFLGVGSFDFAAQRIATGDRAGVDPFFISGTAPGAAAGRLANQLGLHGPAMVVDTACSSSLVAVHLACAALRRRECGTALCGAVSLIMAPEPHIALNKAGLLAGDGRCKTFDTTADGFGRGEGCGLVVLKRLSRALADGDPIWAIIRGSAVNQDGASGGLAIPSKPARETVVRTALAGAGLGPNQISVIEAHGTGAPIGDAVEMAALGKVFASAERAQPLIVGSVKTNIGHLEAAAGIAGLIKTVLAMHGTFIPPHLHFHIPNPTIDWEHLNVIIPKQRQPWHPLAEGLRAGVGAFGATGTNAFVALEAFSLEAFTHGSQPALETVPIPFQRTLFQPRATSPAPPPPDAAALLGQRLKLPGSAEIRFQTLFAADAAPFLKDHHLDDACSVAEAVYLAMLLEALHAAFEPHHHEPRALSFHQPMVLKGTKKRTVQLVFRPSQEHESFEVLSSNDDASWITHFKGHLARREPNTRPTPLPVAQWRERWSPRDADQLYRDLETSGRGLGPSFRRITQIWTRENQALCCLEHALPNHGKSGTTPGILDACLQFLTVAGAGLLFGDHATSQDRYTPHSLESLRFHQAPNADGDLFHHTLLRPHQTNRDAICADLRLCDPSGTVLLELIGLTVRRPERKKDQAHGATEQLLHRLQWRRQPLPHETDPMDDTRWLLVGRGQAAAAFERFLQTRGRWVQVIADSAAAEHLLKSESGPQAVVYFAADPGADSAAPAKPALECAALLRLVQSLATRARDKRPRLNIVTRCTWLIRAEDPVGPPDGAALWGMARVIQREYPNFRCRLLDLDAWQAADPAWAELLQGDREDQIAFRNGERYVARLLPHTATPTRRRPAPIQGTVLICGGLGALGLAAAQRLVDIGVETLVLAGRRAPNHAVREVLTGLEAAGTQVVVHEADIGDSNATAALFARIHDSLPPLKGVIHAAGILDDGLLAGQSQPRFVKVMQPKTAGAWLLHKHTRGLNLDFFILYTSMNAVLGRGGQGAGAAAGAYLTGLAHHRRAHNLPATAIHWGGWSKIGMTADLAAPARHRLTLEGIGLIDPQQGLALLERLILGERHDLIAASIDWSGYAEHFAGEVPPLLTALTQAGIIQKPTNPLPSQPDLILESVPPSEREAWLKRHLREQLAKLTGMTRPGAFPDEIPLVELGVDSVTGTHLRESLERTFALSLPTNLLSSYPTLFALTRFLLQAAQKTSDNNDQPRPTHR
ncbi:SDR family NAD(P)-dependent oxidoreductase [Acanthopleuribacter pedis]|uniref:SDR family NAD(P)-dependent oxidoreductase n=1 Tax=Acanthopleuribacter pedis TaxID=442870 RepID=A0A8J7QQ50_9BACT|nr:SDR family NAD(P)-dependent oxidoreductase [Acanthopleuribacter pedis]MBO1322105.1 SDR family NAD(P)-dependent oxidoreductase [Acanthopleuribacter pedis]